MARIGDIHIGGKEPDTPSAELFPSGLAFALKSTYKADYLWESDDSNWQVELKQGQSHIVARSRKWYSYQGLVTYGFEQAQRCLDLMAVKGLDTLELDHPENGHIAVFNDDTRVILRHFFTVPLAFKVTVEAEVRDKDGNIKPQEPPPQPVWRDAFRYYRMSQASGDIFEAYRNLYLSLEALLNAISPYTRGAKEKEWLKTALKKVDTCVPLARYAPATEKDPIAYFMQTQYEDMRCQLFHAKFPDAILPFQEFNPVDVSSAYKSLLRLWRDIAHEYFTVPIGGGAVTLGGFRWLMSGITKLTLAVHFAESESPIGSDDADIRSHCPTTYVSDRCEDLGETAPGVASLQGELDLLDEHMALSFHRVYSTLDTKVLNTASIVDGLQPSGTDVLQSYQSMELRNVNQPRTVF